MTLPGAADREAIDRANAKFWDELCGTTFARDHGIADRSLEGLRRFDRTYLDFYPYLLQRVPVSTMRDLAVLEVGLGYGTLGQKIAESGARYTGLDIAAGPVEMMNTRLAMQGLPGRAMQGNMLDCPLPDASQDCVVSIGCFHHTGNLARCIDEAWRVLKPGGRAFLMVYNALSYLRWIKWPRQTLRAARAPAQARPPSGSDAESYDFDTAGRAAPETVFVSRAQLASMMQRFSRVDLVLENCSDVRLLGVTLVRRGALIPTLGRFAGLDIYASAGEMSAPAAAGATSRPLDVLVLCNRPARGTNAGTIIDHLDAFRRASVHRIRELSFVRQLPSALDLEQFDVVAIHYTIAIGWMSHHFINPEAKRRLREFTGLKVAFLQDEYRHVDAAVEALDFMGVDLLFTCVPEGEIEKVYPVARLPRLAKRNNLTGYVPEPLLGVAVPPVAARPIDVGYRTRKPPYWLGELGWEKWAIADRFAARAQGCGLRLDLSYREQDRLYGEAWTRFVTSCRSMLGVESGASVFDFDGTLQPAVDAWVAAHPEATFEDVHARFLAPHEGRVRLNQISPRCFEAAALRTPMVLYEGEYSGILAPHRHFVPLRKDLANFDEVLDTIRDHARLQRIADCAYEEVARNPAYGYAAFVGAFDAAVSAEHAARCARRPAGRPAPPRYWRQIAASPNYLLQRAVSFLLQNAVLGTRLRNPLYRIWDRLPERVREFFRPLLRLMGR